MDFSYGKMMEDRQIDGLLNPNANRYWMLPVVPHKAVAEVSE